MQSIDFQESSLTPQFRTINLQHLAFFMVQLSHPYITIGKTIALTRRFFVGKVMSLLLNMLSRLVITVLPRSKPLLISWLQSPSAVILEPKKIKSDTVSTVSPSISHEVYSLLGCIKRGFWEKMGRQEDIDGTCSSLIHLLLSA